MAEATPSPEALSTAHAFYTEQRLPGSTLQLALALDRFRAAGVEAAIRVIEGGRFLHDDAPSARFAREVAAAIRRELLELAAETERLGLYPRQSAPSEPDDTYLDAYLRNGYQVKTRWVCSDAATVWVWHWELFKSEAAAFAFKGEPAGKKDRGWIMEVEVFKIERVLR